MRLLVTWGRDRNRSHSVRAEVGGRIPFSRDPGRGLGWRARGTCHVRRAARGTVLCSRGPPGPGGRGAPAGLKGALEASRFFEPSPICLHPSCHSGHDSRMVLVRERFPSEGHLVGLVRRAAGGSDGALEELYRAFEEPVYGL